MFDTSSEISAKCPCCGEGMTPFMAVQSRGGNPAMESFRCGECREVVVRERPLHVLFLCTGNSARSIMAEAILNRTGQGRFRAFSAGSKPARQVNPYTLDLLAKLGFGLKNLRSKSWTEFASADAPELNFIITVCDSAAAETCPRFVGQPMTAHWSIPDPAAVEGNEAEVRLAFADAYRLLNHRISLFTSLPTRSLHGLSLQKQLDTIGRSGNVIRMVPPAA
jgi:protein-tyrosine-phosphatase